MESCRNPFIGAPTLGVEEAILILRMKLLLSILVLGSAFLAGSKLIASDDTMPIFRDLALLSDIGESEYHPDRVIAEAKLTKWSAKEPDPTDTDAYLEFLSVLALAGKKENGEGKIRAYLAKFPEESRGLFIYGVYSVRVGKRALAEFIFDRLEKDSKFPWKSQLMNNLALLAWKDGNKRLAESYWEKAAQLEPVSPAALVNLGATYLKSRSYAAAQGLFEKALTQDDSFEDAALGLGVCLEGQGKFEDAAKTYAKYADKHSAGLSLIFNHAVLLGTRMDRRQDAADLMQRYIQLGGRETARAHEFIQGWR